MYANLKYLYSIPVFIACLLSSCTSDNSADVEFSKGSEVSFDVLSMSRASATPTFTEFAVYGDMKFPVDKNTAPTVVFNKTIVKYSKKEGETVGKWLYDGVQYWFPNHEHTFIAVTPLSALESSATSPRYSDSELSFTYQLPTTSDNELTDKSKVNDILAATHRRLYSEDDGNATTVFSFGHIMSLVNLAPAFNDNLLTKDDCIKFRKLELSGFNTKAAFTIQPAPRLTNTQTDDMVIDVAGQEGEGKLTVEFANPVIVANTQNNVALFDGNDAIIMLPQAFAADSEAKIILSYTINDDALVKQVTLPLMNQQWESGKSYIYRFTIDRTGAHFQNTTISDWEAMSVGNIDAH